MTAIGLQRAGQRWSEDILFNLLSGSLQLESIFLLKVFSKADGDRLKYVQRKTDQEADESLYEELEKFYLEKT